MCKLDAAHGLVLGAGGPEDGLDVGLDVGGGIDHAGAGLVEQVVAGDAGCLDRDLGGDSGDVDGLQLGVQGGERADLELLLVGGVSAQGVEQLDKLIEVIEAVIEAHLRGGGLGNGFALGFQLL